MNQPHLRRVVVVLAIWLTGGALAQTAPSTQPVEATPTSFPNAETQVYRKVGGQELLVHVMKPAGWKASDKRPVLVWFFGGGWNRGTPERSISYAKRAAAWGMVGVAPDYRVRDRHGTTPAESVADARAAVRWVQDHAAELGIDPAKVVVGGNSAGGHLAIWAAIAEAPVGSKAEESPLVKPAAMILTSPAADTTDPRMMARFKGQHAELSATQNMNAKMPPTILFHGDADPTVPYTVATSLDKALRDSGNDVTFVTIPGGNHGWRSQFPEWSKKSDGMIQEFLAARGLADGQAEPAK
jgi:acetyl esterase/lipase